MKTSQKPIDKSRRIGNRFAVTCLLAGIPVIRPTCLDRGRLTGFGVEKGRRELSFCGYRHAPDADGLLSLFLPARFSS